MKKDKINIEMDVYVWDCLCGHSFSILNMMANDSYGHWGNPKNPPHCPHCGIKLASGNVQHHNPKMEMVDFGVSLVCAKVNGEINDR